MNIVLLQEVIFLFYFIFFFYIKFIGSTRMTFRPRIKLHSLLADLYTFYVRYLITNTSVKPEI